MRRVGLSRTYVVCIDNSVVLVAYLLPAGAVSRDEATKPMQRSMPDPIPVLVMGRLAVDQNYQDMGIGSALLRDAILRGLQVATVGVKAMLVHALSEEAKAFYHAKGFLESPIAADDAVFGVGDCSTGPIKVRYVLTQSADGADDHPARLRSVLVRRSGRSD